MKDKLQKASMPQYLVVSYIVSGALLTIALAILK